MISKKSSDMNGPNDTQKSSFYIAVILYEARSNAPGHRPLYQESFVLIKAASDEEARAKAQVHGAGEEVCYLNENQETITWSLKQVVDVTPILDETLGDGSELYVRHFRNYDAYREFEPLLGGKL